MSVVTSSQNASAALTARAAQYLRMSTDPQKYSIENQAAAIAAYAISRDISIVRTYADRGRSGLRIAGRDGLQELIDDVQFGRAQFDCILVYDVSRWGRFQDVDESAYYEFICRRAGIAVHYCADEFENDGSLSSVILKNIKRVAAADYSRQLSKKVFLGQCNIVSLGFWRGGPAGYGLRRLLVDENGKPKAVLQHGQRKNLKTERVILVPGPKSEVRTVRRIFTSFALKRLTRTEIAAELNADGVRNARGASWSMLTISNVLKNEAYIGNMVYNRKSMKLGQRQVRNPPEMWIRRDQAFKGIIAPELFARAQKRLKDLHSGRKQSDQSVLDRLAALWRRKGTLSVQIIGAAKNVPNCTSIAKRFGSLISAYDRIGFKPHPRYRFRDTTAQIEAIVSDIADNLIGRLKTFHANATFMPELHLLTINQNLTLVITVARSVSDGVVKPRRWQVRNIKYNRSELVLVIRMAPGNAAVQDYFLVPTMRLPLSKDGKKLRISDRVFGQSRLTGFDAVVRAIYERLQIDARRSNVPSSTNRRSTEPVAQPTGNFGKSNKRRRQTTPSRRRRVRN